MNPPREKRTGRDTLRCSTLAYSTPLVNNPADFSLTVKAADRTWRFRGKSTSPLPVICFFSLKKQEVPASYRTRLSPHAAECVLRFFLSSLKERTESSAKAETADNKHFPEQPVFQKNTAFSLPVLPSGLLSEKLLFTDGPGTSRSGRRLPDRPHRPSPQGSGHKKTPCFHGAFPISAGASYLAGTTALSYLSLMNFLISSPFRTSTRA